MKAETVAQFRKVTRSRVLIVTLQRQILQFYFKTVCNKDDSQNGYFVEHEQPLVGDLLKGCSFLSYLYIVDIGCPTQEEKVFILKEERFLSQVILSDVLQGI